MLPIYQTPARLENGKNVLKCQAKIDRRQQQQTDSDGLAPPADSPTEAGDAKHTIDLKEVELQQCQEIVDMFEQTQHIKVDNIMDAARLRRIGELHVIKAKNLRVKVKSEAIRINREANSNNTNGIKKLCRHIGDPPAKPLTCVKRDRDTDDGGKAGEMTCNPKDVDAVVQRVWKKVHAGVGHCIEVAIDTFITSYAYIMHRGPEFILNDLDAQTVYDSFKHIACLAGSLDGWQPRELSYLSLSACGHIANMLNQIEAGRPWPKSALHARVVYLEKIGAIIGEVTSYRPLTITAPLYRGWATMRLRHLQPWVDSWMEPEMHAGVPEMGAVDAWHTALALIEQLKLDGTPFCGGVADIAKFFDQIRRKVVYIIARFAGMPTRIITPYSNFLENLLLYNCLAGGVGTPHSRPCGIPQGCPFSMMIVSLMMKPWVMLMRACLVTCFILADDVLIIATGEKMLYKFEHALNTTHKFLQAKGGKDCTR